MSDYIESSDPAEIARIEEALGRRLARALRRSYPIAPAVVGPGKQPPDLSAYYQRHYRRFVRTRSGGVLQLDDTIKSWEGSRERLEDGTSYTIETASRTLTRAQLTQDSRDALDTEGVVDR